MNHTAIDWLVSINPADTVSIAIAVLAVLISFFVYRHHRKELRLSALLKILELLSTPDQRESRGIIFDVYWYIYPEGLEQPSNKRQDKKMIFDENHPIKAHIKKVTSAFDQAAVLVKKGMIMNDLFLDMYAGMIIRTWKAIHEDVLEERKRNDEVAKWFVQIVGDASDYYTDTNKSLPEIYRRQPILSEEKIKELIQPYVTKSEIEKIKEQEKAKLEARDKHAEDRFGTPNPG